MDRAIYTAMGAASSALNRQAVTSNNLANVNTTGFRAQVAAFRAVPLDGPTLHTRALVTESTPWHDETPGAINQTGRNLDVALRQDGWLAVILPDGTEAYTRNGSIEVDSAGQLTVGGLALSGDGGAVSVPPQAELTIADDGTISARNAGDGPTSLSAVAKLKLVNAPLHSLRHGDDGLFHPEKNAPPPVADAQLRLIPGALESSNVSPVQSMVAMIATARGFEMNMKVVGSVDENARSANQLLSMS